MTQNNNPLGAYFRHPELNLSLPSKGKYWTKDSLVMPESGEIPIQAMTGIDEIAFKNADGLMSGDTTVSVIESCCPSIKNAWQTPNIDLDPILIAIRIASYGAEMDITTRCEKCDEFSDYTVDLRHILDQIKYPNYDEPIEIDQLSVFLKPSPFKIVNLNNQEIFEQRKALISIQDANVPTEQKEKLVREAIKRLTDITVTRLVHYIEKVVMPDGKVVSEPKWLDEFINNCDQKTYNLLKDGISAKNEEYQLPKMNVTCDKCGNVEEKEFQFDPASFFA